MSRRLAPLALALALCPGVARAEDSIVAGAEIAHRVTVSLSRGHARLVAERTLEGEGERTDVGQLSFGWPTGAVVTGLALRDGERWLRASLLDAEPAQALFSKLTGPAPGPAQPTAMVDVAGTLSVFPLRPRARATTRVEGLLATSYAEGKHTVRLSRLGSARLPAQVTLLSDSPGDRLFRDKQLVPPGATFVSEGDVDLSVEPARPPAVTVRVASPGTGRRALFHLDVEVAPKLSTAPARADVIIVIDVSRSRTDDDVQASRAAAATYLSRLGDATAQIITFDRRVEVRTGGWQSSADAERLLWKLPLVRRNGSELDRALERAVALFDARGGSAPRRVLVLGDLLTRAELAVAPSLRALADRGAVTHLVAASAVGTGLTRDDAHELAAATRVTGGLVWSLGGGDAKKVDVVEELVRPVRLDHVAWEIPGVPLTELELPDTLPEGAGHQLTRLTPRGVPAANVRGELWATKVAFGGAATESEDARWSALAFGADVGSDLSLEEQRVLAHRGHAVTSVTSLVVIPSEARGSREGLTDERGFGISGISGGTHGTGIGFGHGRIGHPARFNGAARLRELLAPAWRACGGVGAGVLVVETTADEVAHARAAVVPEGAPSTLASCLVESAFSLDLPRDFITRYAAWQVQLGGDT